MSKEVKTKKSEVGVVPLHDRVLIREHQQEEGTKTTSGIYIPETVREDRGAKRGEVIAVGAGRLEEGKRIPLEVKKGDVILFSWGDKVQIDGTEYFLVREGEISAILTK
jgi:chaperonin GroES